MQGMEKLGELAGRGEGLSGGYNGTCTRTAKLDVGFFEKKLCVCDVFICLTIKEAVILFVRGVIKATLSNYDIPRISIMKPPC